MKVFGPRSAQHTCLLLKLPVSCSKDISCRRLKQAASCILSLCSSVSSSSLLTKDILEKTALRLWDKKFKVRHETLLNIGKAIASSELPTEQNAILIQRVGIHMPCALAAGEPVNSLCLSNPHWAGLGVHR